MADVYVVTADPDTQRIRQNLLPNYLQPEVVSGGLANTVTVAQVTDGVIPDRPTASGLVFVVWRCWDNPAAKAYDNDMWERVVPTGEPTGQALYPSSTLHPSSVLFPEA